MQACTARIDDLSHLHRRFPDQLGQPGIRAWILRLITERKLSAPAFHASGAFCHGLLGLDIQPSLAGIQRHPRIAQLPGYSASRGTRT